MRDRWNKFFESKRASFDDLEPPEFIWNNIEANLKKKRFVRKSNGFLLANFRKIAAMFIISAGAGLFLWFGNKSEKSQSGDNQPEYVFSKEEKEITSLIDLKKNELKQVLVNDPELYKEFNSDLYQLEAEYIRLKHKLDSGPYRDATINALIINLNAQLNALNQQTNIIYKIQSHEKTSI